jgi:hypothetical protein
MKVIENDLGVYEKHLREHAQTIYLGIRKASRVPAGIDKIPAARAQRRQCLKVAAACGSGSNAAAAFRYGWVRRLGQPGTKEAIRKQGFDLTQ